ncbi:1,6-anhydro-N-acetylmuramyl-L-alanine amidase AmpD [Fontimonas sp. SYSU GA230001]|uniref:1,6-anhydro-N-acetylmuramyl-L-alanine amidase AmpD n=1 Tax=Fontimonas sp. SYSU GA230001 TaxID=3142450 RepID=UPI0032B38890
MKKTPTSRKGSRPARTGIDAQGWLAGARRVPSPNCDARPDADDISLLVIHGISLPPGRFGGPWIEALFTNRLDAAADPYFAGIAALRVSAHLLIRRDGAVVQFVPFVRRAWHAGVSSFDGRERCNDFSIGIELEGTDERPYTARQYRRLARVIGVLRRHYPRITPQRVVGHSDIAPGRKTDPGPAFDWARLRSLLESGQP